MNRILEFLRRHPKDRPDIEEFNAEHDELRQRLEERVESDEVRKKIIEARVRNFRRHP